MTRNVYLRSFSSSTILRMVPLPQRGRQESEANPNKPSPVEKGDREAVDEENGVQTTIREHDNPCITTIVSKTPPTPENFART